MSAPRVKEIPKIPPGLAPDLRAVLVAMKEQLDAATGRGALNDKRPTVAELIAAGVTNADKIT